MSGQITLEFTMTWRQKLSGLYAVLDAPDEGLAELLVAPDQVGASVLQVRIKPQVPLSTADLVAASRMARRVTSAVGALLIIDDRLDVALAVDADGVHLGQRDLPVEAARILARRAPRPFLIGVSTHADVQVRRAIAGGADYLGYGPVYPTTTKSDADPVRGLAGLAAAVAIAGPTPVVAIGGVTPARAAELAAAGAAAACAISAVNQSADARAAGRLIAAAWS